LKEENESNTIVNCPYFTTNFIPLIDSATISKTEIVLRYICVLMEHLKLSTIRIYISIKGDTVLIPAAMDYYVINGKFYFRNLYFIVGNRKIICTLHTQIKNKKKWQILRI
jgi:mannose-6-phosphate isomerase